MNKAIKEIIIRFRLLRLHIEIDRDEIFRVTPGGADELKIRLVTEDGEPAARGTPVIFKPSFSNKIKEVATGENGWVVCPLTIPEHIEVQSGTMAVSSEKADIVSQGDIRIEFPRAGVANRNVPKISFMQYGKRITTLQIDKGYDSQSVHMSVKDHLGYEYRDAEINVESKNTDIISVSEGHGPNAYKLTLNENYSGGEATVIVTAKDENSDQQAELVINVS